MYIALNWRRNTWGSFNFTVIVPWLLTLLTAALGIWQFTAGKVRTNRQPFLQKQLELSFQQQRPQLVLPRKRTPPNGKSTNHLLALVLGTAEHCGRSERRGSDGQAGALVPPKPVAKPQLPIAPLQAPSYKLGTSVRDLVLNSWNVTGAQGSRNYCRSGLAARVDVPAIQDQVAHRMCQVIGWACRELIGICGFATGLGGTSAPSLTIASFDARIFTMLSGPQYKRQK